MFPVTLVVLAACLVRYSQAQFESMIPRTEFMKRNRARGNEMHEVLIVVKHQNLEALEKEVLIRSTPGSPKYQLWMSYEEINNLRCNEIGSTSVLNWLKSNGIKVSQMTRNKLYIKAITNINHWENLLSAEFHEYEDLRPEYNNQLVFRAQSYDLPEALVGHVDSMMEVSQLPVPITRYGKRSKLKKEEYRWVPRGVLNCPTCVDIPFLDDFYSVPSNIGSGGTSQSVFETAEQAYSPTDLTTFQQEYSLTIQSAVDINGQAVTTCSTTSDVDSCYEGNLDLQYIMGMSQKTISIYYYIGGGNPFIDWIIDVSDSVNPPLVNSISWGSDETAYPKSYLNTFNNEAMSLAARGVTILVSSGDNGVSGSQCECNVNSGSSSLHYTPQGSSTWSGMGYFPSFPATAPYVTAVGATMGPNMGGPEVTCQGNVYGGVITSGGGFSTYFAAPSWQTQAISTYFNDFATNTMAPNAGYNPKGRGYPDISLLGVNYPVILNDEWVYLYGTSASAPVMAAFVSLVNALRYNNGMASIGFLNPTLYSAGLNVTLMNSSTVVYNDIISGNNKCCANGNYLDTTCCASGFYATMGWDPATGWGSIDYPQFESLFSSVKGSNMTTNSAYVPNCSIQISSFLVLLVLFMISFM